MNMEHPNKASGSDAGTPPASVDWQKQAEVAEQRRRDSQAELTPLQQEVARLKAENEVLRDGSGGPTLQLDDAEAQRLEDLKYSDPDAWRQEINVLETKAHKAGKEAFDAKVQAKATEHLTEVDKAANRKTAEDFFAVNTDLDGETFHKLIPVGLQEDVVAGKITVAEFLEQGAEIIRNAPVKSQKAPNSPDLGAVAGGAAPSDGAVKKENDKSWEHAYV